MRKRCGALTILLLLNLSAACDSNGKLGEVRERLDDALSRSGTPVPTENIPREPDAGSIATQNPAEVRVGALTPIPNEVPVAPPTATPKIPDAGSAIPPSLIDPNPPSLPSLQGPGRFPKVMAFRTSLGEVVEGDGTSSGAVNPEVDFDNLEVVLDKNSDFLKAVEKAYGTRVVTLWHRGWGNIGKKTLTADKSALEDDLSFTIFAGHWMFEVGTTVSEDIDLTEPRVRIYVEDNSNFAVDGDAMIHYYDAASETHDWTKVEHVQVREVESDDTGPFLKVRREAPVEWVMGDKEIRIAPHATIFGPASWAINLSVGSPTDKNGRAGWEFLADYLYNRWQSDLCTGDGKQTCPDGIELDGGRWLPNNQGSPDILVDANNDGVTDYGYVDGIQTYGLGGILSLEALRSKLPDSLIIADSSRPAIGYRGFNHVNGIEMENFPETNKTRTSVNKHYLTGFSSAFLHLRQ